MYTLKTNASFDSAHFLAGYEGKCSNIHGHHWTVEIEVGSNSLEMGGNNRGMIVDFSKLKNRSEEHRRCTRPLSDRGDWKSETQNAGCARRRAFQGCRSDVPTDCRELCKVLL